MKTLSILQGRTRWAALIVLVCNSAFAQYSIDWFTVDGGGGGGSGGDYSLSGTIGQPDAGTMSGGNYTLVGGFWGGVAAVQIPILRIAFTTTNSIVVAWPDPSTGFVLEQSSALNADSWSVVATTPVVMGEEKQVIVSPPTGNRFYRLRKQ